ncbi:MAG: hypothetical protein WC797_02800 [Candidatus Paceibacterota bacterium]|jgi:hypothetical protein
MVNFVKNIDWSFPKICFIASLTTLLMLVSMLFLTNGKFIYIQDDAYIHLEIAKNLVDHGVWGVSYKEAASASSSPLWIIILAFIYLLVGNYVEYAPLVINIVLFFIILKFLWDTLVEYEVGPRRSFVAVLFIWLVTPLGPFIFGGMEHLFHILVVLMFLKSLESWLTNEENKSFPPLSLFVLTFFVAAFRYEGMFLVASAVFFVLLKKKVAAAITMLGVGAMPMTLFGLWSVNNGLFFLPNSLLMKKKVGSSLLLAAKNLFSVAYGNIKMPIFTLFGTQLFLGLHLSIFKNNGDFWRKGTIGLGVVALAFILHAIFGRFSWVPMYRYEAYLVLSGILYLFLALRQYRIEDLVSTSKLFSVSSFVFVILFVILSMPFIKRLYSWPHAVISSKNIYEQHYQLSKFFDRYYKGKTIGANDIGAISYFGGIDVIDFWGLADNKVASAKMNGSFGPSTMENIGLERGMDFAVLFESWFGDNIPKNWIRVASWTIEGNVVAGSPTVTFFMPNCLGVVSLQNNLRDFSSTLKGVSLWYNDVDICHGW